MTPREWVELLDAATGNYFGTTHVANLADGLAELLAAREPAKEAPIGPGVRFEYIATGGPFAGVWTVIDTPDGLNLSCHGETWWNSHPARRSAADDIRALTDRIEDGMRLWRRLPDQTDYDKEVKRLTAELAAKDKVIADNSEEYARLAAAFGQIRTERDAAYANATAACDARDHAEMRTAELEQAIRVLIGKLGA